MANLKHMPMEHALKILSAGMDGHIESEIEKALMEVVQPKVKAIAARVAKEMLETVMVEVNRDPYSGEVKVLFVFNGKAYGADKNG